MEDKKQKKERRNVFADVVGGQILLKIGLTRHWKFILYVFALVVVYISIQYGIRNTLIRMVDRQEKVKSLRSEYVGKSSTLLNLSQNGEIEKMLRKHGSSLQEPKEPPTIIKVD